MYDERQQISWKKMVLISKKQEADDIPKKL